MFAYEPSIYFYVGFRGAKVYQLLKRLKKEKNLKNIPREII